MVQKYIALVTKLGDHDEIWWNDGTVYYAPYKVKDES